MIRTLLRDLRVKLREAHGWTQDETIEGMMDKADDIINQIEYQLDIAETNQSMIDAMQADARADQRGQPIYIRNGDAEVNAQLDQWATGMMNEILKDLS